MVLALMSVAVIVLFLPTWREMTRVWFESETFGHCVAVMPISTWMIWRIRERWMPLMPTADWLGLPLVLAGCVAWILADLASVNVIAQYGLLTACFGLVLCVLGRELTRVLVFPLALIYLMVPAGDSLNAILMEATASFTIAVIRLFGVPVLREGLFFSLPSGSWSVVEACSGLRYLIVAFFLGLVFAWLNFTSLSRRVIFVLTAVSIALVGNWLRATSVVLVGHLSNMRYGTGEDHVIYGWVFFGVVMLGLFYLGARWKEASVSGQGPGSASSLPLAEGRYAGRGWGPHWFAAALIVLVPLYVSEMSDVSVKSVPVAQFASDLAIDEGAALTIAPLYAGARATLSGRFRDDPALEATVAYFARQKDGSEMIVHGNGVASKVDHWTRASIRSHVVPLPGTSLSVREHRYVSSDSTRGPHIVWTWYAVGGWATSSPVIAKMLTAASLILGRGDHSVAVVVSIPDADLRAEKSSERHRSLMARIERLHAAALAVTRK